MKSTMIVAALAYAMFGMTIASPMTELDSRQATDPTNTDVSCEYLTLPTHYPLANYVTDFMICSVTETMTAATHQRLLAFVS